MLIDIWTWIGQNKDSLGVVVGGLGVLFLAWQINQSDRQEKRRIERRHLAARATLPLALSGVCEYARAVTDRLTTLRQGQTAIQADHAASHPVATPNDLIASIEKMIEATTKPRVAKRLSEIVAEIQVLQARMNSVSQNWRSERANLETYLIDAATIEAMASSLFDYARHDVENIPQGPIPPTDVTAAFNRLGLWGDEYDAAKARILRREPSPTWWQNVLRKLGLQRQIRTDC